MRRGSRARKSEQQGSAAPGADGQKHPGTDLVKVVYFDERSASDYLDIAAGGASETRSEYIRTRTSDAHAKVENKVAAKLSWLPFLGASAEVSGGVDVSRIGKSILSQTLSNTILTDYLEQVESDRRVRRLSDVEVSAPPNSMAYMKMFTPYMIIARGDDMDVDLARMDEALERAKGYYELLARSVSGDAEPCVLRFNISAFRNNYGLADLGRMSLVFHAVRVGHTTEDSLTIDAEMGFGVANELGDSPSAQELIALAERRLNAEDPARGTAVLEVLDVILAGVEHG